MFASDRKLKNMRQTKIKSAKDVVNKINTWIKKVDEEVEATRMPMSAPFWLEEKKSSTGYELYHKTFSDAMQHAYDYAKKKGHIVDPKEIDDKVATGPKKPSKGKTNRYSLKAGRKKVEIQVFNMGKKYELNMYIEGVVKEEVKDMAGEWGTDKLTNTFKNDTPGQGLDEKWAVGVVYHQDFGGGEISYFRADALLKNKRWKGMGVDEYSGKQKKPRNITADEKVQGWKITPKNKIPKGLKEDVELSELLSSFNEFITEGRPAGKIRDDENTTINKERQKLVDSQEKNYTLKDIESIARKYKIRFHPLEPPMKFGPEWSIITDKGIKLNYDKRENATEVTGWKIDKKKLRQYKDKYENEETRIQDVTAGKGKGVLDLRGFESAFEVIGEKLIEDVPANATGAAVVGTGDDPTVWKKKKRKNAKVETEEFGSKKVFVVSPDRYWNSRLGKSRYNRYEKYVGNDKLGEAIRQYGITNPNSPIILKNSETGAMLYLKYGK
jgi:hypothetical protein